MTPSPSGSSCAATGEVKTTSGAKWASSASRSRAFQSRFHRAANSAAVRSSIATAMVRRRAPGRDCTFGSAATCTTSALAASRSVERMPGSATRPSGPTCARPTGICRHAASTTAAPT
jgi:hypothetical protein